MKKGLIMGIIALAIILVVITGISYYNSNNYSYDYNKVPFNERNLDMEKQFKDIIQQEIQSQSNKGLELSLRYAIVFNYDSSGIIFLNCQDEEQVKFDDQLEIAENIGAKLAEKFPQLYGPEGNSSVDIHICKWGGYRLNYGETFPLEY